MRTYTLNLFSNNALCAIDAGILGAMSHQALWKVGSFICACSKPILEAFVSILLLYSFQVLRPHIPLIRFRKGGLLPNGKM